MITGDLDLDRVVWDAEYRRQVIDFLKSLHPPDRDRAEPGPSPSAELAPRSPVRGDRAA